MRSDSKKNQKRGDLLDHLEREWYKADRTRTKQQLLDGLKTQRNTWASWKQGYTAHGSSYAKIAEFFGVTPQEIETGEFVESIDEDTIASMGTILDVIEIYESDITGPLTGAVKKQILSMTLRQLGKNPSRQDVAKSLGFAIEEPQAPQKKARKKKSA